MNGLILDNLMFQVGGLHIVRGLSLQVAPGEILALIGPNGAGKTSVLNLVSGFARPTGGDIRFDEVSIAGLSPDRINRMGIARTFQSLRLFLNMSVLENVLAAGFAQGGPGSWQALWQTPAFQRENARRRRRAAELLSLFGSRLQEHRHDQPAYALSYANRRRLEIARALMTGPRLLLLDEPAAGMNPQETAELAGLIRELRDRFELTILLIEHDMAFVEHVADRVIVLDHGSNIAEGSYHEVAVHPAVVEAYLGHNPEVVQR